MTKESGPVRRAVTYLNEKTWISLGFVLTLLGAAVALTHQADGIDNRFDRQDFTNDKILRRLADMSEKQAQRVTREELHAREAAWRAWVDLLRAKLPAEMQNCVPEAPK